MAWALGRLGYVAHIAGDYERAAPLCAASVALEPPRSATASPWPWP